MAVGCCCCCCCCSCCCCCCCSCCIGSPVRLNACIYFRQTDFFNEAFATNLFQQKMEREWVCVCVHMLEREEFGSLSILLFLCLGILFTFTFSFACMSLHVFTSLLKPLHLSLSQSFLSLFLSLSAIRTYFWSSEDNRRDCLRDYRIFSNCTVYTKRFYWKLFCLKKEGMDWVSARESFFVNKVRKVREGENERVGEERERGDKNAEQS